MVLLHWVPMIVYNDFSLPLIFLSGLLWENEKISFSCLGLVFFFHSGLQCCSIVLVEMIPNAISSFKQFLISSLIFFLFETAFSNANPSFSINSRRFIRMDLSSLRTSFMMRSSSVNSIKVLDPFTCFDACVL